MVGVGKREEWRAPEELCPLSMFSSQACPHSFSLEDGSTGVSSLGGRIIGGRCRQLQLSQPHLGKDSKQGPAGRALSRLTQRS